MNPFTIKTEYFYAFSPFFIPFIVLYCNYNSLHTHAQSSEFLSRLATESVTDIQDPSAAELSKLQSKTVLETKVVFSGMGVAASSLRYF